MILLISSFFFLALGLFFQIRFPGRIFLFRSLLGFSFFAVFIFYFTLVFLQYRVWQEAGPPSSYLIPPYRSILYVFWYHFFRFLLWYLISAGIALLLFFSMRRLNARGEERFFEREEPELAALSAFLLGNPAWNYAWLYYFLILGLASVFGSLALRYVFHSPRRFSFYWLWIPVALGVIIMMNFLV